jgi:methylated-DNA-[protein]-cysteine S-methyltransferase
VRIILDSTVGIDTPWMAKVQSPAYRYMNKEQLEASIQLGEQILSGHADLTELNNKSLTLRGKTKSGKLSRDKVKALAAKAPKRKAGTEQESPLKKMPRTEDANALPTADPLLKASDSSTPALLAKIANSSSTPFQKRVLSALMQVPSGQYTTYGILAKHLQSNARAVGSGLRNNPFAPQVPCHRVLASGGGIGGFKGSWGRNGKEGLNDAEKRRLLREEGVKFDGTGRVIGRPWEGFRLLDHGNLH